jgi:hypothetical protein
MVGSLIMAVALTTQPPAPRPATTKPAAKAKATPAQPNSPLYREPPHPARGYRPNTSLRGRWAAYQRRVEAEDAEMQRRAAEQYERMLPYMLENQRQMLQRQSDYERNVVLDRYLNPRPTPPPIMPTDPRYRGQ